MGRAAHEEIRYPSEGSSGRTNEHGEKVQGNDYERGNLLRPLHGDDLGRDFTKQENEEGHGQYRHK